jgi:ABC-type molybdate transport system substrate-binding protein
MTENVRAALTLVARGEAPLGIVYATDAKVEPSVKIIGTFPADFGDRKARDSRLPDISALGRCQDHIRAIRLHLSANCVTPSLPVAVITHRG